MNRLFLTAVVCLSAAAPALNAQDPTGAIEGEVRDKSGASISGARVAVTNRDYRFEARNAYRTQKGSSEPNCFPWASIRCRRECRSLRAFRAALHPRNRWRNRATVDRPGDRDAKGDGHNFQRGSAGGYGTNTLGKVVTGREITELPLNGRNFTQLGLLQTGVAPLTAGVRTAEAPLRQGQAYTVNGMRPESNVYLVDGAATAIAWMAVSR